MTGTHPKRRRDPNQLASNRPTPRGREFPARRATDFCHLQKTPRNEAVDFNLGREPIN
jgi:hypothetical protein